MVEGKKAQLIEYYYLTGSVLFGDFAFSVHVDNPGLERSPNKLHYPKVGESGSEYLPKLYELAAEMFDELLQQSDPPVHYDLLAAIPDGANGLAVALAVRHEEKSRLLRFEKHQEPGRTEFVKTHGEHQEGETCLIIDDHVSGGRNKLLMKKAVQGLGLKTTDMLVVVDRDQGGPQTLAAEGIRMHSLVKLRDIMEYGVGANYITEDMAERALDYAARHQSTPSSKR